MNRVETTTTNDARDSWTHQIIGVLGIAVAAVITGVSVGVVTVLVAAAMRIYGLSLAVPD